MEFHDGLCRVANGSKWGFIDKRGKVIVEPQYVAAQDFSDGLAAVCSDYRWGFIDRAGNTVIAPKYEVVAPFEKGTTLASVKNWKHPFPRMMLMLFHLSDLKFRQDASSKTGFYIPENLDDALNELAKIMPPKAVQDVMAIPENEMNQYHMGFGTSMRNSWGLWSGERLGKYFNGIGIKHPDDMSAIVLCSYWRKLHGKPIELTEQVQKYKQYWKGTANE